MWGVGAIRYAELPLPNKYGQLLGTLSSPPVPRSIGIVVAVSVSVGVMDGVNVGNGVSVGIGIAVLVGSGIGVLLGNGVNEGAVVAVGITSGGVVAVGGKIAVGGVIGIGVGRPGSGVMLASSVRDGVTSIVAEGVINGLGVDVGKVSPLFAGAVPHSQKPAQ